MDCTMDITMDVDVHQYAGVMELTYINHSPDALDRIPFHLFFNAFQPESMMDVRSRNIADPDRRVGDRIVNLPEEDGGGFGSTRPGSARPKRNSPPKAPSVGSPCPRPSPRARRSASTSNGTPRCRDRFAGPDG